MFLPLFSIGQISNPFARLESPSDNSPYSRFGLGDLAEANHAPLSIMGNLTAAYHDKYNVNIQNPASLPHLKATSFEVGLNAKYSRLAEGAVQYNGWTGNLSYFSLAFPLSNPINDLLDRVDRKYQLGMSFSLNPYTSVGYDILTTGAETGVGNFERNYIGAGGTYTALWGTGLKVKDFSVGVNLGYLFGKIGTNRTIRFFNLPTAFNNFERINTHITGFVYNLGLQYDFVLNKEELLENPSLPKKQITIGMYGNPSTSFNTSTDELFLIIRDVVPSLPTDTIVNVLDAEGKGKLPGKFGVGVMYNNGDIWGIGINFETQNWSAFENDQNPIELINSYKVSMGGFYSPNPTAFNYFKRIQYKAGIFYSKEPFEVLGQEVDTYGITAGFGLPFVNVRKISNANIGVGLGVRGRNTAISEEFVKLNFGFTFNSTDWFLKRKYN